MILTGPEVARIMRVNPRTVVRWAKKGRFPDTDDGDPGAFKLPGGRWRFRQSSVDIVLATEES